MDIYYRAQARELRGQMEQYTLTESDIEDIQNTLDESSEDSDPDITFLTH